MRPLLPLFVLMLLTVPALAASGPSQVAPETHPPGDIPDTQAFVRYVDAPGGYSLEVPEGWSRSSSNGSTVFTSKLGSVSIQVAADASAPSVAAVRAGPLMVLGKIDPTLKVSLLRSLRLPCGPAVLARFTSTGPANAVTGRRPVLDNDYYVTSRAGRWLTLRLSGPRGSDNIDAWARIARSLTWRP